MAELSTLGSVIKTAYEAEANAFTDAKNTKLTNIETAADVTDATNVAAAGAVMDGDLGTGVATALAVNVGSAGAPVTFNGALGTPSSGVATNLTGTAAGLTAGNVTTNANLTGDVTSSGSNATTIAAGAVDIAMLSATGTPSSTTYLTGDNTWSTPAGSGLTVTSGAGAPSSTPAAVGDIYVDTTADATYNATGTVSSADWTLNLDENSGTTLTATDAVVAGDSIPFFDFSASDAAKQRTWTNIIADLSIATLTATETYTNKTLTSPAINQINDANGAESIIFTSTASAVNEFTFANAATGNDPTITASGETNVGISIQPKGTGDITLGPLVFDGDQTVDVTKDNFVLTYDDGTGKIQLEATAGGGSPEGTSVLSTGEAGGTKFLREDGDNSSSWQPIPAIPISTGVSGLGTGVATALAVNVGTAGAPVTNGGALGTPSSGNLGSCTAYPGDSSLTTVGTITSGTWTGTTIAVANGGTGNTTGPIIMIPIAISDETTALTTGTAKLTYSMPAAFTLTDIRACVTTAPVGATLTVDVNSGGTSIMTTNKLDILTTAFVDDATATLTTTALANNAKLTLDIDTVGSSTAGAGLKVTLIGHWT